MNLERLRKPDCKECELHSTAQAVCLIGDGPVPCDIMIVGEAPSFRKEDIYKPFAGKAGKVLDVILGELGLDRSKVYMTNVVHCRPPENRTPKMEEIRKCREYLLKEIKYVKPKVIFAMGNIAIKGLFDSNLLSISKERGKILDFNGIKVIPTYHPAATLYQKYYANILYEDLRVGLERIKGKDLEQKDRGDYKLVTKSMRDDVYNILYDSPKLAVDLETTGLDFMDKKLEIVTVNMSIKPYESFVWDIADYEYIKDIILHKKLLINHVIKFDLEWLHRYKIRPKCRIFDTMVAKHILDENYPDKELKHLARVELGMFDLSEANNIMVKHRKENTRPTMEEYVRYGGGDTDAVMRLYYRYKKQLKEEGLYDLFKTEMKVLRTLTNMETWGFKIDLDVHKRLCKEYKRDIESSEHIIKRMVGDINLNSPKQLAVLLYSKMNLPILKTTESGAPSCDEATVKELVYQAKKEEQKEFLEALLNYRKLNKLYNTYLIGLTNNNLLKSDGRIHCDFKICGTKTGRLSCSDPNLENIPRDGDIKKMFISSFDKGQLIQVDYSQMELRILSHYANDKNLIRAFKEGRDIHKETTAKCLHKPYDEVTEEERKVIGKRVNFGIVYMIGAQGLSERIGCSVSQAKMYILNWFEEFHKVKEWMNERREEIIETGKSISFNGRIRRLYGANTETGEGREAIRQGVNSPIQGGAGDITKYNMFRLDKRLRKDAKEAHVVNNVHDAVVVDCPREEVKEVIAIIKELFVQPPVPLLVDLDFEIKVGPNWKEMKEI